MKTIKTYNKRAQTERERGTLDQLEVQSGGLIFIFAKNYRKNCRSPCICFCGYCCRPLLLLAGIGNANYRRPGTLAIWPYPAPLAAMFVLGRKEKSGFPSLVQLNVEPA